MKNNKKIWAILLYLVLAIKVVSAQNPIITNQFSADPSARVFGDKVYLYPSHDILAKAGKGRPNWFCMEDYHVFSSENLTDWTDHGVIVSQNKVGWVDSAAYSMWAPDCVYKNGKYYFYFPAPAHDPKYGRGFSIGVAVSDHPYGPFVPLAEPIKNARGIDPCPFIDKDGQAYLYWAQGNIYVAKLKENMTELASEPQVIEGLPEKGLKEGPFTFERKDIYYLTYPHVQNKIERLEYAVSNNPMGPFKVTGVMMDESSSGCWTNHQSVINFKGQWYLFYHNNDLSPKFDKNRSVRIDSLFFNADGTIRKVIPTFRGVGLTDASGKIQIDRYSRISSRGASIAFLDTLNHFGGWKVVFNSQNAWVQYNRIDFSKKSFKTVKVRAFSKTGSVLQIRLNNPKGPIIASIRILQGNSWAISKASVRGLKKGVENLVVSLAGSNPVEADWVSFE